MTISSSSIVCSFPSCSKTLSCRSVASQWELCFKTVLLKTQVSRKLSNLSGSILKTNLAIPSERILLAAAQRGGATSGVTVDSLKSYRLAEGFREQADFVFRYISSPNERFVSQSFRRHPRDAIGRPLILPHIDVARVLVSLSVPFPEPPKHYISDESTQRGRYWARLT